MRKGTNKSPREDKISYNRTEVSNRRLYSSKKDFAKIPAYTTVDDEEYFFEVEDF